MSKNEYIKTKGWANCIAWSPNGKSLTVAVHNSTLIRALPTLDPLMLACSIKTEPAP